MFLKPSPILHFFQSCGWSDVVDFWTCCLPFIKEAFWVLILQSVDFLASLLNVSHYFGFCINLQINGHYNHSDYNELWRTSFKFLSVVSIRINRQAILSLAEMKLRLIGLVFFLLIVSCAGVIRYSDVAVQWSLKLVAHWLWYNLSRVLPEKKLGIIFIVQRNF